MPVPTCVLGVDAKDEAPQDLAMGCLVVGPDVPGKLQQLRHHVRHQMMAPVLLPSAVPRPRLIRRKACRTQKESEEERHTAGRRSHSLHMLLLRGIVTSRYAGDAGLKVFRPRRVLALHHEIFGDRENCR